MSLVRRKSKAKAAPRVRIKLNLGLAGLAMSPEEFDAVTHADLGFRYELIGGILVVSRYPSVGERDPNGELDYYFRRYRNEHPEGYRLDLTLPGGYIHIGPDRRRADRVVWIGLGREPVLGVDVPAIAVEFVSKSKRDFLRDYVLKRDESLRVGVKEYWVIDRFRRSMTVYQLAEPAERVIAPIEVYRTPLLPGFELPMAQLLKAADDQLGGR